MRSVLAEAAGQEVRSVLAEAAAGQHEDTDLKSRHHCTDVPCCIIFIVSVVAFVPFYCWCVDNGELAKLYHGANYKGQLCGVDPEVAHQPYLYWCAKSNDQGRLKLELSKPICVSSCPGTSHGLGFNTPFLTMEPGCTFITGLEGVSGYPTKVVFRRFCIPNIHNDHALGKYVETSRMGGKVRSFIRSLSSIPSAWPALVAAFFVSVIIGYTYLFFLRHCAETLIWVSMALCIIAFGWMGIFVWTHAEQWAASNGGTSEDLDDNVQVAHIVAAACFVMAALISVVSCCLRHSVAAAAACIEVACDEIFKMPSLLVLPLFKAIIKGVLFAVLLFGFVSLVSHAPVNDVVDGSDEDLNFTQQHYVQMTIYALMSLWLLAFVSAVYQFTVAYASAEYYFTEYEHDEVKDVGCCAVWDGLHVGLSCHMGSLALGSLLIALLELAQKVLEHAERKQHDKENQALECILAICICFVKCFKDCVEILSKNAYIDMAITSDSFCGAAHSALGMIVELGGAMAILNGATFVFSIFGGCLIAALCAAFTYRLATTGTFADETSPYFVDTPATVMVVGGLIGLYVSSVFMDLLDMASDTLLYCYGYDMKDGSVAHTAPPAIKDLVHSGEHGKEPGPRY